MTANQAKDDVEESEDLKEMKSLNQVSLLAKVVLLGIALSNPSAVVTASDSQDPPEVDPPTREECQGYAEALANLEVEKSRLNKERERLASMVERACDAHDHSELCKGLADALADIDSALLLVKEEIGTVRCLIAACLGESCP